MNRLAFQRTYGGLAGGRPSRPAPALWLSLLLLCLAFAGPLRAQCDPNQAQDFRPQNTQQFIESADWDGLEDFARDFVRLCPSVGKAHYWLGVSLFNQKRFFAASRSLRQAAELGYPQAHLALAQAYAELNQGHFFKEEIEVAKKLAAENASVLFVEGEYFYEKERRLDLAEKSFRRIIDLEPSHSRAHVYLGLCLRWEGRLEEAEAVLAEAAAIAGSQGAAEPLAYQSLAEIYLEIDRPEKALIVARKAVEADPQLSTSQFLLGKSLWKLKRYDEAVAVLERAVALDDSYSEPRYLLGQIYLSRGDRGRAAEELAGFRKLENIYGRAGK